VRRIAGNINATHPCSNEVVTSFVHIGDWFDASEGIMLERAALGTVKGGQTVTRAQCQPNLQFPEGDVGEVIKRRLRGAHRTTLREHIVFAQETESQSDLLKLKRGGRVK
jgi:hypothetical protein